MKVTTGGIGAEEECETITNCMIGLDAFVHLGIGLGWSLVPDAGLADLKARLDPDDAERSDSVEGDRVAVADPIGRQRD